MYVDPITSETFQYANQIPCENNPQNVMALDRDTNQYNVLTPQRKSFVRKDALELLNLLKSKPLLNLILLLPKMQLFILKKTQTFLESCSLLLNILDNTLQLLSKTIDYEFMSKQSSDFFFRKSR